MTHLTSSTTTVDAARVAEAASFAIARHGAQLRKGTTIPYWAHLAAVAGLVAQHGGTTDQVVAAWLHDVVEDCGGTAVLDEVRAAFGDEVAAMVHELSDSTVEDPERKPPWRQRKEDYIAGLREHAGAPSVLVSLADKLHNAESIVADLDDPLVGTAVFERFSATPADTAWQYRALLAALRADGELPAPLIARLAAAVARIVRGADEATDRNPEVSS